MMYLPYNRIRTELMKKMGRKTTKTSLIKPVYIINGGDVCNIVTTYERHQRNRIATRCIYYIVIIKCELGASTALRVELSAIFLSNLNFQKS